MGLVQRMFIFLYIYILVSGMKGLTVEDRLGAAVGGLLADSIGWRWEFGVCIMPPSDS